MTLLDDELKRRRKRKKVKLGRMPASRGGGRPASYSDILVSLFGPSAIVGLWPQNEPSGAISQDIGGRNHPGAYTGVALGQPGIGDGSPAAGYDGTTGKNNIYSAGLNADFNGAEGTLLTWVKVANAGVWTDATLRRIVSLDGGASDAVKINRSTVNNTIQFVYLSGGITKQVTVRAQDIANSFISKKAQDIANSF